MKITHNCINALEMFCSLKNTQIVEFQVEVINLKSFPIVFKISTDCESSVRVPLDKFAIVWKTTKLIKSA